MSTKKLELATMVIGDLEVECAMLPDGTLGMTAAQVNSLLRISTYQTHVTRSLKALLGEGSQLTKVTHPIANNRVNFVTLQQVSTIAFRAAMNGNEFCRAFCEVNTELTLTRAACRALGIKFDYEDEQSKLKARLDGKVVRRSFTDALKAHGVDGFLPRYMYANATKKVYRLAGVYHLYEAYKKEHNDSKFRDTLNEAQIREVMWVEDTFARALRQTRSYHEAFGIVVSLLSLD